MPLEDPDRQVVRDHQPLRGVLSRSRGRTCRCGVSCGRYRPSRCGPRQGSWPSTAPCVPLPLPGIPKRRMQRYLWFSSTIEFLMHELSGPESHRERTVRVRPPAVRPRFRSIIDVGSGIRPESTRSQRYQSSIVHHLRPREARSNPLEGICLLLASHAETAVPDLPDRCRDLTSNDSVGACVRHCVSDDERKKTNDISWCDGKRRPIKLRDYLPIITKLRVDHGGSPALAPAATVARNMSWW